MDTWNAVEVDPWTVIPGVNIRLESPEHVMALAESMWEIGQIRECTVDTSPDGTIRV